MTRLFPLVAVAGCALGWGAFALAQDTLPESVFRDYEHMRSVLDDGMLNRNIVTTMRAFGASSEMSDEDLTALEQRVRSLFPKPLTNVDVMKSVTLGENWTQELYAFHGELRYVYAMVLFHTRPDALVAVTFKFNTDPVPLLQDF